MSGLIDDLVAPPLIGMEGEKEEMVEHSLLGNDVTALTKCGAFRRAFVGVGVFT